MADTVNLRATPEDKTTRCRALKISFLSIVLLSAMLSITSDAQVVTVEIPAEGVLQKLELIDGSILYGRIIDASDPATFRTEAGIEIVVPHVNIKELSIASGEIKDGKFWQDDPNRTRLFFGPTARTMPAGSGYFSVFELVMPVISIAPTDWMILSGGTPLIFGGDGPRLFYGGVKVGPPTVNNTDLAGGFLVLGGAGDDEGALGILYGVVTHGTSNGAITVGLGFPFSGSDLDGTPAVMIGGEVRVGSRVKIITENYGIDGEWIVTIGPRFFGDRLSADVGLAIPVTDEEFYAFPIVNFVVNW